MTRAIQDQAGCTIKPGRARRPVRPWFARCDRGPGGPSGWGTGKYLQKPLFFSTFLYFSLLYYILLNLITFFTVAGLHGGRNSRKESCGREPAVACFYVKGSELENGKLRVRTPQ